MFNDSLNLKDNRQIVLINTDYSFLNFYINDLTNNYIKSFKDFNNKLKEIESNPFLNKNNLTEIKEITFKNIKVINTIKYFLRNRHINRNYEYPITEDLHFNKLSSYDSEDIIHIKDSVNRRYWSFYYKDLINIIKTSIKNNEDNFPNPLNPKNPYTNQIFTISNLYKIYSKINNYDLPLEVYLYYKNNFNKRLMLVNHWIYFVKSACKNYVKNMNDIEFLNELIGALKGYLNPKQYDWEKIKDDKNMREKFENIVIKINLSENTYFSDKELEDIKKELLSIIQINSYKRIYKKVQKKFIIEKSANFINQTINEEMQNKYMQGGVFVFGGNEKYREVKSILEEIITKIEGCDNTENIEKSEEITHNESENINSANVDSNIETLRFHIGVNNRNLNRNERRRLRRRRRERNRRSSTNNRINIYDTESESADSDIIIENEDIFSPRSYTNNGTNTEENYLDNEIDNLFNIFENTTENSR